MEHLRCDEYSFQYNSELNAKFEYNKNFLSKNEIDKLTCYLDSLTLFNVYDSTQSIVRKQLWIKNENDVFCKEWKKQYERWTPHKFSPILFELMTRIESYTNSKFNSCLINYYRDGNDFVRMHQDTSASFGLFPTIANISLGDTRDIIFESIIPNKTKSLGKENKNGPRFSQNLGNGSLFIMRDAANHIFKHGINKCASSKSRYSLTFRNHN